MNPVRIPFQSQSSGGLFSGQHSSTIAPTIVSTEIEELLALLGQAARDFLAEALVDGLRLLSVTFLNSKRYPQIW